MADHVIVVKNNTVIFEYLKQAIQNEPVQIRVIETPEFGEVVLKADQAFEYTPTPNLCKQEDQFTYLVQTDKSSAKVVVSIEILCENLTIYNGMATGENDKKIGKFKILGVENFPENSLYIFDNEGNQIYTAKDYKNDWNGKVDSTEHLIPETPYFYVFNNGRGNYYSGYLNKNE